MSDAVEKVSLPALNLPRKVSRLPRVGRTRNPFKAGTSKTGAKVKRALGLHSAALAANQIPGKAVAAGALGAKLGGPGGAAAAFSATEAASIAATTLLARSVARRGKAARYLSARSKRTSGVYKAMLEEMQSIIEKAGLIRPGKPPLMKRVAFLLSTNRNERNYRIGRYLEGRKAGKRIPGTRRPRTGTYTGVYATGVNKAELPAMDVIEALYGEIEKAARRGGPRSGLIPYGSNHQYQRARFFQARAERRGETQNPRAVRARAYLAQRYRGGKGPGGRVRTAFYKSAETPVTDVIDDFYDSIEKARGMIPRGGSSKLARRLGGARAANARGYLRDRAARTWRSRGGVAAVGARRGVYKSDAVDAFADAVEKARASFRGQTMTTRQRRHWAKNGNIFTGAAPAGRVSAKDSGAVKRKLKRAGAGVNAKAAARAVRARGARFQHLFGRA